MDCVWAKAIHRRCLMVSRKDNVYEQTHSHRINVTKINHPTHQSTVQSSSAASTPYCTSFDLGNPSFECLGYVIHPMFCAHMFAPADKLSGAIGRPLLNRHPNPANPPHGGSLGVSPRQPCRLIKFSLYGGHSHSHARCVNASVEAFN